MPDALMVVSCSDVNTILDLDFAEHTDITPTRNREIVQSNGSNFAKVLTSEAFHLSIFPEVISEQLGTRFPCPLIVPSSLDDPQHLILVFKVRITTPIINPSNLPLFLG
ncbi:hypothetical protein PPTG_15096 [Phytophthora nicotianae INRA-310]|uniref:Uncharacterized protein n=1 Tax=Phytophthora nicotianae (strain INRA-310) TaxID=761204 RepID=W2PU28_PHYN3|nr:hypothetical protein PPTG_15096 [Phytophthora nicotianae INRA-310]ETN04432.1 hypothetical protein PPTG_15096 [Phytophthora nicotianae INRA-310]